MTLDAPMWLRLACAALATYRVSALLVYDAGPSLGFRDGDGRPAGLLERLRAWAGAGDLDERTGLARTDLGRFFNCPRCVGVWTALLFAALAVTPAWWLSLPAAVAGAAALMERR